VTEGRVLVLNAGSATLKATVLDLPSTEPRFDRTVDWSEKTTQDTLRGAVDAILEALLAEDVAPASVNAVGHRVVHGGERFAEPTRIDDDALAALEGLSDLAPLHNPRAVATIRAAREMLAETPHVAVFDTAFHATLPEAGRRYPVPDRWVTDHGVRRFGFHGLSVAWSVRSAGVMLGRPPRALRLVVAHLGGGCSVTAIADGRSVDTSMGLTPLEGLMMGTRAGSIDPGIVFRLLRAGLAPDDIERALEGESGLLGVGGTDEMRRLLALESEGDDRAALAIELFVRRAAAGIAAAMTTLDGLDALVFTGGIGEHAATIRSRICERLRPIGIPAPAPDDPIEGVDARTQSGPTVLVVHAREDVVIADAALAVVRR
jgi:acetate kinase